MQDCTTILGIIEMRQHGMGHIDVGCTENHYHRNRRNVESKSVIISSLPDFTSGNHKGIKANQKIKSPEV